MTPNKNAEAVRGREEKQRYRENGKVGACPTVERRNSISRRIDGLTIGRLFSFLELGKNIMSSLGLHLLFAGCLGFGIEHLLSVAALGPIQEAINSGAAAEYDKDNCTWRRGNEKDSCPDPDVHIYLYTPGRPRRRLDTSYVGDWLRQDYDPVKENIILIHGYAG